MIKTINAEFMLYLRRPGGKISKCTYCTKNIKFFANFLGAIDNLPSF